VLAGHLGRPVAELEQSLTSRELTEWMAFYRIAPFGQVRDDDRMRALLALMFNVNRGKDAQPAAPSDFLKTWEPPVEIDHAAEAAMLEAHFERLADD